MTKLSRMKSRLLFSILFLIAGCGFTSGSYKDIIKAQEHINEREYKEAVSLYKSILLRRPSKTIEIKISYQLAEINYLYLNKYQDAVDYYTRVTSITDDPLWQTKALEKIGLITFENLKDYKSSRRAYTKLKNFIPRLENQDFYNLRFALTYFNEQNYSKASEYLKEIIIEDKSKYITDAFYNIGLINFYKRKWETAVSYWFEYLKREKRKDKIVQIKFLIANAYESGEKLKEAYNVYYSIISSYPNPEVIKSRLNSLYQRRVARKR